VKRRGQSPSDLRKLVNGGSSLKADGRTGRNTWKGENVSNLIDKVKLCGDILVLSFYVMCAIPLVIVAIVLKWIGKMKQNPNRSYAGTLFPKTATPEKPFTRIKRAMTIIDQAVVIGALLVIATVFIYGTYLLIVSAR
jgi:hypothetical protein